MKKIFLIFMMISCASAMKPWTFTKDCLTPESVYFDQHSGLVFIANIDGGGDQKDGKGHISLLKPNGDIINSKWISGLDAPKGMRAYNGHLWVSDIDRVHQINIKTGIIAKTYIFTKAKFLNDIAISNRGDIFISDTIGSTIYKISKGSQSVFMKGAHLESPNGLLFHKGELHVAAWGLTKDWSTKVMGRLYKINMNSKKITYISQKPLGHLDGLEFGNDGSFYISDWTHGKVFKIDSSGASSIIFEGEKGLADIGYNLYSNTLYIPYMNGNKVFSHKL